MITIYFNADALSEDLMIALRKRAEIDAKHLIVFVQNDSSELRQSLNRYIQNDKIVIAGCLYLVALYG